jgi:hypothetical protein
MRHVERIETFTCDGPGCALATKNESDWYRLWGGINQNNKTLIGARAESLHFCSIKCFESALLAATDGPATAPGKE